MSKPLLADAILSLEDAALFIDGHVEAFRQDKQPESAREFRAKADELRSTIARLQRNAEQETSESGERAHGR